MIHVAKRLAAQVSFYGQRVDFYLADHDQSGKRMIARSIGFEPLDDGLFTEPSFGIPLEAAQELFEQLWQQGFRPAKGHGSTAELDAARKEHISDLRRAAKLDRQ